ncbi:hypothetical protein F4X86_01760 [Candidatus Saccharibacteria bacterium]|nr:hypothetical protein [Candidatus Saccharibacteria bacterium]
MDGFVINEEAIRKMLHCLRKHKPEQATREHAIKWLEILQGGFRKLAIEDPEFAEELEGMLLESEKSENEIQGTDSLGPSNEGQNA